MEPSGSLLLTMVGGQVVNALDVFAGATSPQRSALNARARVLSPLGSAKHAIPGQRPGGGITTVSGTSTESEVMEAMPPGQVSFENPGGSRGHGHSCMGRLLPRHSWICEMTFFLPHTTNWCSSPDLHRTVMPIGNTAFTIEGVTVSMAESAISRGSV